MMNTDMKKHVVHLLDTYHKRARQIAVLRYELSDPVKITEEEMIDTLQFAHREGAYLQQDAVHRPELPGEGRSSQR